MLLTQKCEFFSLFTIDRLEIMLGDFAEKKKTFLTIKKTDFFKVQKIAYFQRVNSCFCQKTPIYSVFTIDQKKTRNNA